MVRTSVVAFLRDESASVVLEYFVLVGILGIAWIATATEYKIQVIALYARISRDLARINF